MKENIFIDIKISVGKNDKKPVKINAEIPMDDVEITNVLDAIIKGLKIS